MNNSRGNANPPITQSPILPPLILLTAFTIALTGLTRESMWGDEIWSLWAIRDGWGELWHRVAGDVHPPLYFLLLRGWTLLVGETPFAVRYLSVGTGLIGLAFTYALGRRLFDRQTGLIAMIWLASSGLWVYYSRETRMYTLLLMVAVLAVWCYWRWLHAPNSWHLLLKLGLVNAVLLYTHYAGFFLIGTQLVHLLLGKPRRLARWLLGAMVTLVCYSPWLPLFLQQIAARPHGLPQPPAPTNWTTTLWLMQAFTGGIGILLFVPYLLGRGWRLFVDQSRIAALLLLWALLSPTLMLTINGLGVAIYEVRYIIGALPAVALLTAVGIRQVRWRPLGYLCLLLFVAANFASLQWLRPPKPAWEPTMRAALSLRQPEEPTLVALLEPRSPEVYYDRVWRIQNSRAIDVAPLRHQPDVLRQTVAQVAGEPAVWVIMPNNIGATWLITAALDKTHTVGYRAAAHYMLFYRFDRNGTGQQMRNNHLTFDFGTQLRFLDPPFAEQSDPPLVAPGARDCRQLHLHAHTELPDNYTLGLHLVDPANRLIAQDDQPLAPRRAGEQFTVTRCITVPTNGADGLSYQHLIIYDHHNGTRLPVAESGVAWGEALIIGAVTVGVNGG